VKPSALFFLSAKGAEDGKEDTLESFTGIQSESGIGGCQG
jgi:hypothetical protein